MNLARHQYIAQERPHAGLGMSAHRTFDGGDPGDSKAWRLTQAEADAVKLEALPAVADPEAGIVGMGACQDATTRRPCPHAAECMRLALALQPLTCVVREAALDEAADAAAARAVMLAQVAAILAFMRQAGEPVTLADCAAALGCADEPLKLRGAWNSLTQRGKLTRVGRRLYYGSRHTHYVWEWIITEGTP